MDTKYPYPNNQLPNPKPLPADYPIPTEPPIPPKPEKLGGTVDEWRIYSEQASAYYYGKQFLWD